MQLTETFRVWVRTLGNACRIRVEGVENARWLVNQLSETPSLAGLSFVDIVEEEGACSFQVPNSSAQLLSRLETVLGQIPNVRLMLEPEPV